MAKKDEFKELNKDFENLPDSKKKIAMKLLDKAIFMEDELQKLQNKLRENGWTEEYKNGANQYGIKKSSEGEIYIALSKNYSAVMKQLNDFIPDNIDSANELVDFIEN